MGEQDRPWDAERIAKVRERYAALDANLSKLGSLGEVRSQEVLVELMGAAKTVPLLLDEAEYTAARLAEAEREAERLREGMFRRGVTLDGVAWIDCRGCGPLGYADSPAPHSTVCWVAALAPAGGGAVEADAVGDLTYEEEMAAVRRLQEAQAVEIERPDNEMR